MSRFSGSFSGVADARMDMVKLCEEFRSRFPNLAEAFGGQLDENGVKHVRHPGTITMWFEVDRFKFVVCPRYSSKIAFGSGTDGLGGFSEIEQALDLGNFEWKLRGGRKSS